MNTTQEKQQFLEKLAQTPKGQARAELLKNGGRDLVLNSGANVTMYCGNVCTDCENVTDILRNIYLGVIQRKNTQGKLDGLGALGGLAERTSKQEFNALSQSEKQLLVGKKDDVIMENGEIILTTNMAQIRVNNVLREMREELTDLGVECPTLMLQKLELISMPNVKDDNYIINIWNGDKECFAVNPYCHIYHDQEGIIDTILRKSQETTPTGEVAGFKKIPLIEALGAFGHIGTGENVLEDMRSADKDYRYPHVYLAVWALAGKLLNHNEAKMIELAQVLQEKNNHPISLKRIADASGQSMSDVAQVLQISNTTLEKMESIMRTLYTSKQAVQQVQ